MNVQTVLHLLVDFNTPGGPLGLLLFVLGLIVLSCLHYTVISHRHAFVAHHNDEVDPVEEFMLQASAHVGLFVLIAVPSVIVAGALFAEGSTSWHLCRMFIPWEVVIALCGTALSWVMYKFRI